MKTFRLSGGLLAVVVLLLVASSAPAVAQNNCAPISGTVYGAFSRAEVGQKRAWHMLANFTIGQGIRLAAIGVKTTSIVQDADNWQGGELWTLDFGEGHTIQLQTSFVTEHMTNAGGVYHIREVGTFVNGTGAFVNAYGNLTAEGPFGPGVVLHDVTGLPLIDATMFWVAPSQGTICGVNSRD